MKTLIPSGVVLLLIAAPSSFAQTQLVRGDVDSIQGTNQFRLDCTQDVRLVSRTVNLQQLHDQSRQRDIEYELQVIDISVPGQTILDVISAAQIPEMFDMGNLRFGRAETWEFIATPGSPFAVYVGTTAATGYFPLGPIGTWVLGADMYLLQTGNVNARGGVNQFRFTMPNLPALAGTMFTSQAILLEPSGVVITNPDCKAVRN